MLNTSDVGPDPITNKNPFFSQEIIFFKSEPDEG